MNRRGFLDAMLGAMAAPAVVKAESLMRIVVPKRELIVGRGMTRPIFLFDEGGYRDFANQWTSPSPETLINVIRDQVYKMYRESKCVPTGMPMF